ncbi:hypothetical protein ACIRQP_42340 [Streptomyces sp. NPDC102274]|uniref:hypothetical protein n=1 Tax=Streptomyces sp. NPDC102274 TaxID=3366151 RepID=UPI00381017A9
MDRHDTMTRAWWVGLGLSGLVLGALWLTGAYSGGFPGVVIGACVASFAGVVPVHGLARWWLMSSDRRTPGWIAYLAVAVFWSAALSLVLTVLLLGLPHGWEAALSWANILRRVGWIGGVLVPATLGTYLVTSIWDWSRSLERGGLHR